MAVLVRLLVVPRMLMVVRAVLAGMLMVVPGVSALMVVRVLVLVHMLMAVGVLVRMGMHPDARMLVRMLMRVGVFMPVVVGMLMVALHGCPPFGMGFTATDSNIVPRRPQGQPARMISSCARHRPLCAKRHTRADV
ncbi:MAG: hypothetical protein AUJ49_04705 [Desulfovibrionaceae bacterium CG1_02_65_16]|nr:MAG: hypothetical protein AUJ49_04705 [Desulfovibrionaceae bacterium CG1_02_65_16]